MLYSLRQNYLPSVSKTICRCGNMCSSYLRLYEYVLLCFPPNLTNANFFLPSMTIYDRNTVFICWENRVYKRTADSIVRCTYINASKLNSYTCSNVIFAKLKLQKICNNYLTYPASLKN